MYSNLQFKSKNVNIRFTFISVILLYQLNESTDLKSDERCMLGLKLSTNLNLKILFPIAQKDAKRDANSEFIL